MDLIGDTVRLRLATNRDTDRFLVIVTAPGVVEWWRGYDRARVLAELTNRLPDVMVYAVEVDGTVIGLVQTDEEDHPEYRHAGIDLALHPDWHGRGLGADTVRTLARHLFTRGHHRIVIDPAADNVKAIQAYSAVGFRPVGVMRQYERGPDDTWHDGLLMDLLRDELV
ncbi:GNAT family N-acetyltransferase [Actinokineospora sp.]|uniref:GNAT family N-acetyltransferase n=1 Tax=Actinokineospora sp. TaxID=1872133 RepID=UPI004037B660